MKLYQIKLSARVETPTDLLRVQNKFQEKIDQMMDKEGINKVGHIKALEWHQIGGKQGVFPDINIHLTLARWITNEDNELVAMTETIQYFLDSCNEVPDAHVLSGSLNFADIYDGEREEHFSKNNDNIFEGLQERLEYLYSSD